MEADFSGWATKAGLKCSDGLTILPNAFQHQDQITVPLVWQHNHTDPENVLGHVMLTNKPEGVWCDAFFNGTPKAKHAKQLVVHKDINQLSIWANDLIKRSQEVLHGKIREVSLVLAGANPGALIDPVSIRHTDGDLEDLDNVAIIYTGLPFELSPALEHSDDTTDTTDAVSHATGDTSNGADTNGEFEAIYESMNDRQKELLHFMLGEALSAAESADPNAGAAVDTGASDLKQDDLNNGESIDGSTDTGSTDTDPKGNDEMGNIKHNVFEAKDADGSVSSRTLSHDDMAEIMKSAKKSGSLKEAVENWAGDHLAHGIQDIDILFPDATTVGNTPEMLSRRVEWVTDLMGKVTKRPFTRIRTFYADLTVEEARAKGYVKGSMKKEEFFRVARRSTGPTTIYKKQKLDRDDIIDITDFDVVAWLKAEMRLMLDEEIARAILVGDGREAGSEDKIDEDCIRPIVSDHELYTVTVSVNIGDTNSSIQEGLDAVVMNRQFLRGSGMPTFYTTETYIARFLLLRDNTGRKQYRGLDEVARDLRVDSIIPVEILSEYEDIIGIMVNPSDYVVGTDRGGSVSMFDDFDIDYNQYKYLIETRMSGALVKLKSAMVLRSVPSNDVLIAPDEPAFDGTTLVIPNTPHVVYRRSDTSAVVTNTSITLADGQSVSIVAEPASGYFFENTISDGPWSFTGTGA